MDNYRVEWPEAAVENLLRKVADCRLPQLPESTGWSQGCDRTFLARLQDWWVKHYDWRKAVDTLNRYPQFIARVSGFDIHFVHVTGETEGRRPLLLTHGWPGSHWEFWNVIERLAFPSRYGGSAEDAFDLIIPSLPGFGFSGKPRAALGQRDTAAIWNTLMTEALGYRHYLAQGGDFGAIVTSWLGMDHADAVLGIHLNMMAFRSLAPPQNDEEAAWLPRSQAAQQQLGAYSHLHMTKPNALVWATADNPLGQAAWILERFYDWSDLRGRSLDEVFPMDHLITNIMIYLTTDSFASSLGFYRGVVADGMCILPDGKRCETPTAYAAFPGDALMPPPPRSRLELTYNIVRHTSPRRGGHFAAMEEPGLFVDDIQSWGREALR